MKDLFDFNHIDPSINEETKKELKEMYKYYHKLWWCHKKTGTTQKNKSCCQSCFCLSCHSWNNYWGCYFESGYFRNNYWSWFVDKNNQ